MAAEAPISHSDEPPAPSPAASTTTPPASLAPSTGLHPSHVVTTSSGPNLQSPAAAAPPSPAKDAVRPNFAAVAGYVVPAPSFSYSVLPRGGSGGSPASVPKLVPSMPPAALQPPVPGQYFGSRPSFSYNVVSHPNANHHTGQQFQLNTAVHQGTNFVPPASLQPPVPGQLVRQITGFPGSIATSHPSPIQLKPPNVSEQTNQDFGASLQSRPAVPVQNMPTNVGNVDTTSSNAGGLSGGETCSQSVQSSTNLSSSIVLGANAAASMHVMPLNAPLPHNGTDGVLGAGNTQGTTLLPKPRPASSPSFPLLPTPSSVPAPLPVQNSQYQFYPSYPAVPSLVPPPHPVWLNSSQPTNLSGPLQTYPASFLPSPSSLPTASAPTLDSSLPMQPKQISASPADHKEQSFSGSQLSGDGQQTSDIQKQDGATSAVDVDAWTVHKTETGLLYYYNSVTGESTYQRPANFKGEIEKIATAQSIPVSWEKLAGTDWTLVTTNDGKKYYFDNKTKVSSWQLPPEVLELSKNAGNSSLNGCSTQPHESESAENAVAPANTSTPAVETGGRDSMPLRESVPSASSSALDLIKKKLQDNVGAPGTSSEVAENGSKGVDTVLLKGKQVSEIIERPKDTVEGNESDSSSESDDDDQASTKELSVVQFKEMLRERGILPFAKWEKELPKLVYDARFQAVPSYSRRSIFEHYVKTRAEEERKEKKAAQKAAMDAFKQLLEDASEDIDHKSNYQEFKRKWGSDSRFQALDRKERESLFSEKVKALQEKIKASQAAAMTNFKSMLRESKNIDLNSRWTKIKENFRSDPRYRAVSHEARETLFNEFLSELKSAEDEVARAAKAKLEEQDKLKERERELRKRKEREEQEMERVKLKIRRKDAVTSYQALLVEIIKDPKASWTDSKPKLEKDPQGRAANPDLSQTDAERLFRDHIKDLLQRCARDFRTLLSEVITTEAANRVSEDGKTVLTSWTEAKKVLKDDQRYIKLPSKDRESLWRRHADELTKKLKESDTEEEGEDRSMKQPDKDKARRK